MSGIRFSTLFSPRLFGSLHWATRAAVSLAAAVMFLANVPGEPSTEFYARYEVLGGGRLNSGEVIRHGWPWAYLTRQQHPWLDPEPASLWAITGHVVDLDLRYLTADAIIALLIVTSIGVVLELRVRRGKLLQFSLRSMVLGVAALSACLAWYVREKQLEKRLVKSLDVLEVDSPFPTTLEPRLPAWIGRIVGDRFGWFPLHRLTDYECELPDSRRSVASLQLLLRHYPAEVRVTIHSEKLTSQLANLRKLKGVRWLEVYDCDDRTLSYIAELTDLRWLAIHGNWDDHGQRLTNRGLAHLRGLRKLKSLYFGYFFLDDLGMRQLAELKELELLGADYCSLTDRGLASLHGLPRLRTLQLCGSKITDAGCARLPELPDLHKLDLSGTGLTDAGILQLSKHDKLRELDLSETRISNDGLGALAALVEVRDLDLRDTQVSNVGLRALAALVKLRHLDLAKTNVSEKGLAALAPLAKLESLDLTGTQVVTLSLLDDGVFPRLRFLSIPEKQVAAKRLSEIRLARPELFIEERGFFP